MNADTNMMIAPLDWHPKRFTAGDMDGTGGDRLLGRTSLSPLEILIREMAQNSWDARLPGAQPEFGLHLRPLNWRLRADINMLLSRAARAGSASVRHSARNLHVLEIFDRGTTGLDGPVDFRVGAGGPRNYEDLILKVGVPRDDGYGGGTYGFGKTAAYAYSEPGIVVYWTCCRAEAGGLEHRFIVSSFQNSYSAGGHQYTGRHWWGRVEGDLILPLVGSEARRLGEHLFDRHFEDGETGTSILILDPRVPNTEGEVDSPPISREAGDIERLGELFRSEARSAIRRHLWPKMVPDPVTQTAPMTLSLTVSGSPTQLIDSPAGTFDLWAAGLNAIRRTRAELPAVPTTQGLPVRIQEITRYSTTIGHLAFVRRVPSLEDALEKDDLDPQRVDAPTGRIALMRGIPELVVSTENWIDVSGQAGSDWLAVFKSADAEDRLFAEAEPPAHDMWVEGSSPGGKLAGHTRRKVTAWLREQLTPQTPSEASERHTVRVGSLARRFGQMLPTDQQPDANSSGRRREGGERRTRISGGVDITSLRLVETLPDGRQVQQLTFTAWGPSPTVDISLSASEAGEDGLREPVDVRRLGLNWHSGAEATAAGHARVAPGETMMVDFIAPPRRAIRLEIRVEASRDSD